MNDLIDIAEIARRTGVTSRTLRYYEERGLLAPLRTYAGRRLYGPADLERLHELLALRRAGFTLRDMKRIFADGTIDFGTLLRDQLAALDGQMLALSDVRDHVALALDSIARGEPLDTANLCSLIRDGATMTEQKQWKSISDRYISARAEADFAEAGKHLPADFDQAAYSAQWADLSARIEAAQPLDPASPQAVAFVEEWEALLAPFAAISTPAMEEAAIRIYDHMDEWQDEQAPPFSSDVWNFIQAAGKARKTA